MLALHDLPESVRFTTGPGAMRRPGFPDVPGCGSNGASAWASSRDLSERAPSTRSVLRNMSTSNMRPTPRASRVDQRSVLAGVPVGDVALVHWVQNLVLG